MNERLKEESLRIIIFLIIVSGFGLIITSVSEISHVHFSAGLLLFTLGVSWYAYRKGHAVGEYNARAEKRNKKNE